MLGILRVYGRIVVSENNLERKLCVLVAKAEGVAKATGKDDVSQLLEALLEGPLGGEIEDFFDPAAAQVIVDEVRFTFVEDYLALRNDGFDDIRELVDLDVLVFGADVEDFATDQIYVGLDAVHEGSRRVFYVNHCAGLFTAGDVDTLIADRVSKHTVGRKIKTHSRRVAVASRNSKSGWMKGPLLRIDNALFHSKFEARI